MTDIPQIQLNYKSQMNRHAEDL